MTKMNKVIKGAATLLAMSTPMIAVVACNNNKTNNEAHSYEEIEKALKDDQARIKEIKNDKKFKGYSKDTIRIIGHKQEVDQESKGLAKAFNQEFGTKIIFEQVGGTTNYSQYLSAKLASGNGDVGLIMVEQKASIDIVSKHSDSLTGQELGLGGVNDVLSSDGTTKLLPAVSESLGVIYNKDVFKRAKITVHEGKANANATDGLIKSNSKITDVYTDDLTKAGYTELANQLNSISGVDGFYSTTKSDAGNIWPYTNHLLSAAIKNQGTTPTNSTKAANLVLTQKVASDVDDALDIYRIGSDKKINTIDEAMGKLAAGIVAMSQNGTWGLSQILKTNPQAHVGFLPLPVFGKTDSKAKFEKGVTQKWALLKQDESKQKTAKMFLKWLYDSKSGLTSLFNHLQSGSPFDNVDQYKVDVANTLMGSASNYNGSDVITGGLAISTLPKGFDNGNAILRTAIHDGFESNLTNVIAEYTKLSKK